VIYGGKRVKSIYFPEKDTVHPRRENRRTVYWDEDNEDHMGKGEGTLIIRRTITSYISSNDVSISGKMVAFSIPSGKVFEMSRGKPPEMEIADARPS
jgi:DNA-dependent RNA polymerase auxiliary subunit epsilon